jgi:PBSX family phage terminase large subunit
MNNDIVLSEKQREFLGSHNFARINLLEGSVRSGKTWISLIAWALFVASMPRDAEFLMVGKTLTTLRRNCLGLLQEFEPSFTFSTYGKHAKLYGRTIWLEGASDEMAENKIRGMTLAGVYMDELTLIPSNFYYMALSRLSVKGAKLFATTNPDSPSNYVYTDIVCNDAIDKRVTKFLIRDNPFLEEDYVDALENEYKGVFYQRFFLGEWVIAEGLVYPMYENTVKTEPREYTQFCVSMDYGIMNATAMILWGYCDGIWYAVREYYHSGRATNQQKTDEQYYEELEKLCGKLHVNEVIIDPSAASFITLMHQKGRFTVRKADNAVLEGIQNTATCLARRSILINDCCTNTINEFGLYSWDSKSTQDAVIKENDHAMDAVRYFVQTKRIYRKQSEYQSAFSMF